MSRSSHFLLQENQEPVTFSVLTSGSVEDDRLVHHQDLEEEPESCKGTKTEQVSKNSKASPRGKERKKPALTLEISKKRDANGFLEVDDDDDDGDDGFKTPTRPENRIPKTEQFPPPAPRKPKQSLPAMSKRRRTESSDVQRRLDFISEEVVTLFLADLERKVKKSRRQEN